MPRKYVDCREIPSEKGCTLLIAGEADEVVRAATLHAVDYHGEQDTPELRKMIAEALKDDVSAPIPQPAAAAEQPSVRH